MALMNCPECGNKISDQSEVCVHCGYVLAPDTVLPTVGESGTNVQSKPKKNGKKKLIIVAVLLCLIVATVAVIAVSILNKPLNIVGVWEDETTGTLVDGSAPTYHYSEDGNVKLYVGSIFCASGTYSIDDDDILHMYFNSGILLEYTNVRAVAAKVSIKGDIMTLTENNTKYINGTSAVTTLKRIE